MIGQRLAHYRILEQIGAGGMGVVYRARDEKLERDVALKVLPAGLVADEAARKRFRKEALTLSQLNHPNIATLYDFDHFDGMDFLVMELIPGATLQEKLATGELTEREIIRLGIQLAQGLAAAHELGVVHRDLKPGNLRVTPDGRLKILDFGLATLRRPEGDSATTASLTQDEGVAGTVPYMAPEQLRGEKTDARIDIYAAGTVLYEMSTGRRPFHELNGPQLIAAILQEAPQPPSSWNKKVAPALESIILKALDKDPEHRYQSAKELSVDLERISAPTTAQAPPPIRRHRRWIAWAAAGALVVVLALFLGLSAAGWRAPWFSGSHRIESLAVLPFENLTGGSEQDYFADGMTDALITDLAKIGSLRVISRPSVMPYKGTKKPLREIADELRVDAVLSGTVLRAGEKVRITAQLIDTRTERHLWAESYERDLRDILALQRDVTRAVVKEIQIKLTPQEQARLARAGQVNPKAYEAYLKGRSAWSKQTDESSKKAIQYFQQAIGEDPLYALAYAGLADAYYGRAVFGFAPPREVGPLAQAAALKAKQLDDNLAEAHVSLGMIAAFYDWAWQDAEQEFRRAADLNPGYGESHHWYAHALHAMGRLDESLAEMKRAQQLDPLSPYISDDVGNVYYFRREYDQAMQQCLRTIDLDASFYVAYEVLGLCYEQKRMFAEAVSAFEKATAISQGSVFIGDIGHAYAAWGNKTEAEKRLAQLEEVSKKRYVAPFDTALIHIGLGEKDTALGWLEKAYEDRSFMLTFSIKTDPRFDSLRSNPRFRALLNKMGLNGR